MLKRDAQRGDTLIEVIVAFGIFSLVLLGVYAVMNRGIATAQESLEVTLVRSHMDSQASLLRFARNIDDGKPSSVWSRIKSGAATAAPGVADCVPDKYRGIFYLGSVGPANAQTVDYRAVSSVSKPSSFAKINYDTNVTEGIWVQAVRVGNTGDRYQAYDMHIRACWDSPFGGGAPLTLSTIVRLYDN